MIKSIRRRAWVILVAASMVVTACGDDPSTESAATADIDGGTEPVGTATESELDIPREFFGRTLGLDGFEELEGGELVNISGGLLSADGVRAQMTLSIPDLRVEGRSTECGGETHDGPFTTDTDLVTTGTISIAPWGTLDVEFTHTSTVFNAATGPPFCDEQIGTWTGSDGELKGSSGTIHRLRMGDTERVTLSLYSQSTVGHGDDAATTSSNEGTVMAVSARHPAHASRAR